MGATVVKVADFSGYATKANLKCSDGRTILPDAFSHQAGKQVPLVWQHDHDNPENILGHVLLEGRKDGMYAHAYFNNSERAQAAKEAVEHGDINSMSIWANKLIEKAKQVAHGMIKEVSLVLSGANPGALIDQVRLQHDDGSEEPLDEAVIYTGLTIEHGDGSPEVDETDEGEDLEHAAPDATGQDVLDTMDDDQKNLFDYAVHAAFVAGQASTSGGDAAQHSDDDTGDAADTDEGDLEHQEGTDDVTVKTSNVFEKKNSELVHGDGNITGTDMGGAALTHDQLVEFADKVYTQFKQPGQTFKTAFLAHADDYGITNIEVLFPDAKTINAQPQWIARRMDWVDPVLNGVSKVPFQRIKSQSADLTQDSARAKGYKKGEMKKEQFFAITGRKTGPATIYKKQKLDRDDIIDASENFDVVAWLWVEMRFMLREEFARAILIGDGREVDDDDKIPEPNPSGDGDGIRPIAFDDDFYTDVVVVDANVIGQDVIEAVVRNRDIMQGSGTPSAFMTRAVYNDMYLEKDRQGRRIYKSKQEVMDDLEVDAIYFVPVMDGVQHDLGELLMVLVNLGDYSVGQTRGGEVTTFEDFNIDLNQYKYLIETRGSGALTKFKSAQVVVRTAGTEVAATSGFVPTFNSGTGVVTIPTKTGVTYKNDENDETLTAGAQTALASGDSLVVKAHANTGYYFPHNTDTDWTFTRP